jgi:hypothetical protein
MDKAIVGVAMAALAAGSQGEMTGFDADSPGAHPKARPTSIRTTVTSTAPALSACGTKADSVTAFDDFSYDPLSGR